MNIVKGNANKPDGDGFLSGPRLLLEQLRERQLDVVGGQDLDGSGFEDEEADPNYFREV